MTYEQFKEDKRLKIEAIADKMKAFRATNPDSFSLSLSERMALWEVEMILATPYPKYQKGTGYKGRYFDTPNTIDLKP